MVYDLRIRDLVEEGHEKFIGNTVAPANTHPIVIDDEHALDFEIGELAPQGLDDALDLDLAAESPGDDDFVPDPLHEQLGLGIGAGGRGCRGILPGRIRRRQGRYRGGGSRRHLGRWSGLGCFDRRSIALPFGRGPLLRFLTGSQKDKTGEADTDEGTREGFHCDLRRIGLKRKDDVPRASRPARVPPARLTHLMEKNYDFLVLGGGSAGYAAARTAHDLGLRVAVIDGARDLGGLCILRGCMPSKTLIESANRSRAMRRAEEFGLRAAEPGARVDEIIARKKRLIGEFADYRRGQLEDGRFDLIRGTAAFTGADSVRVSPLEGGEAFSVFFRTCLIATGSVVTRLPVTGLEETGYWTSDEILDATELPASFIVLGGGAIALEMACYLEGLGRKVDVIQRSPHLLSTSDTDVAEGLEKALRGREEFTLHTGTKLTRVGRDDAGRKTVHFQQDGGARQVSADEILQAVGRVPNTRTLGAETAGLVLEEGSGRVLCGDDQRTRVPGIFAAGDVCGPYEIVHIAIEQGEIAAHNAAVHLGVIDAPVKRIDYRLKLLGIFTDPQVATVGLSEKEARAAGRAIAVATYPFDDHGKSMVMGETHGFVKLIADTSTGEILGGAVVGPEAVELIHEIVVAMAFRATAGQLLKIPHYHPTLSEIWTYPAEDLSIYG